MKRLIVGNGLDKKTSQGPLINEKAVLKVERHIKESVDQGARVICGGNRLNEMGGTFFEPTVLLDVTNEMPVSREETFGPIAPLLRYESYCQGRPEKFGGPGQNLTWRPLRFYIVVVLSVRGVRGHSPPRKC